MFIGYVVFGRYVCNKKGEKNVCNKFVIYWFKTLQIQFFFAMNTLLIIEIRCRIFIKFKYLITFFKTFFVAPSTSVRATTENELAEFKQMCLNNV